MSAFGKLLATEVKVTFRDAPVSLVAIAFPTVVVAVFGAVIHPATTTDPIRFFFQPMSLAMGIGVLCFSLMATEIASYREKGILRRLAATPISPTRLLGAQLVVNAIIALIAVLAVLLVGGWGFGFPFPSHVLPFLVAVIASLAALLSIGLFIAAVAPASRVATGIGVGFYFINLILGGIFIPASELPASLARIGDYSPLGAMMSSLQTAWSGSWPSALHLLVLAGWAIVFGGLAVRTFRWE